MKLDKIIFATILALCGLVFADIQEPEQQTEATKDSVSKHTMLLNIGYLNGLELSYVQEAAESFENDYILRYGPGFGVILGGERISLPIFFNIHLGLQKNDFEYFLNNRLGTNIFGEYNVGKRFFYDIFYEPSIGIQNNNLNLSLGYNFSSGLDNSFVIRAGYRYYYEKVEEAQKEKIDSIRKPETTEKSQRYFRPGIELNYHFYHSKIDFFDKYNAGGAGLFFRIGPEFIYLTTGIYYKMDFLEKQVITLQDLNRFGFSFVDLSGSNLNLSLERGFIEVPLLLSFGSGQIRFTGGTLFDFGCYEFSEILNNTSSTIENIEDIRKLFSKSPNMDNMYWVLGLDFDIFRYWGIGVKFLILNKSWSYEASEFNFEPIRYQARVSTYFVF